MLLMLDILSLVPLKKMKIEWEVEKYHFPNTLGNQVPCSWNKWKDAQCKV